MVAHRVLGKHLVRGAYACRDSRARVPDAHHLEQLLHRPILPVAAVQCNERDIGAIGAEAVNEIGAHVDRDHRVT